MKGRGAEDLARRVRVAKGEEEADLVLAGGDVVNVFTQRIERADVAIAGSFIAGVGPWEWRARERIDVRGMVVSPGLIDAHMHLESTLLSPFQLARAIVPRGTSVVVADPHEIGNVLGVRGIEMLLAASEGLPLSIYFMAPSCVPASPFESAGLALGTPEIERLLAHERVLGLAEMMNFPGVLAGDREVLAKVAATTRRGRPIDGHAPGLLGRDLVAYASAGIGSDHESTTAEEARQRSALGMLVQVREGSMSRDLDAILPSIVAGDLDRWCLCTDDVHPADLLRHGHLDGLVRRVVAAGVPAATAIRHAALVPAQHYGLRDRGAVAPGYRADVTVFGDAIRFEAKLVCAGGRVCARDGRYEASASPAAIPHENTIHLGALGEESFRLRVSGAEQHVIGVIPDSILTRHERRRVRAERGEFVHDPAVDVAVIACVHRHEPSGRVGLGLVSGFGLSARAGALGSSVGHDAHNLLIVGTNPRDMLCCARAIEETGGGFVAVADGAVTARMPLPVAGLLSTEPLEEVCRQQNDVDRGAAALGCRLHSPFGTLSFLGLTVIPALKITDRGLFDVERFARV